MNIIGVILEKNASNTDLHNLTGKKMLRICIPGHISQVITVIPDKLHLKHKSR